MGIICLICLVDLTRHNLSGFPPNLTRQAYNVISMDFRPIWPPNSLRWCLVESVQLGGNPLRCLPGQIGWKSFEITLYTCLVESVELGGNLLRLHCMPARSNRLNWVEIYWDYIVCLPGRIGWKSIEITLYACLVNRVESIEITLYACLVELGGNLSRLHCMPAWLNRFNWVEIYWDYIVCLPGRIGHHLMDFHPIQPPNLTDLTRHHLNGFPPNLTRHCLNGFPPNSTIISVDFYPIQPVINAWSNWLNLTNVRAFESSSQWISTQFDRFDQPSSQWKINIKLHNTSEVDSTSKSTSFIKLLHFWVFQYFLSSKSTFMTCPQTGQLQF